MGKKQFNYMDYKIYSHFFIFRKRYTHLINICIVTHQIKIEASAKIDSKFSDCKKVWHFKTENSKKIKCETIFSNIEIRRLKIER